MKVSELVEIVDGIAPFALAMGFDNPGLILGDREGEVTSVLVALDATLSVVEEARRLGAEVIVSHHPLLFSPTKHILEQEGDGAILRRLIEGGISLIAAHTNFDVAPRGLCWELACRMGLRDPQVLMEDRYGLVGDIPPMTLSALAQHTKERLDATCVKYAGEPEGIIRRLAVACGSGRTAFPSALAAGAQAVITGEASYDSALTFGRMGLSILEAGHFDTEKWFMDSMASRLQNELGRLQYNVRIHISKVSKDVYSGAV